MIASLVNGIPGDRVSILDRGLQFGDGLFETLAIVGGQPCLWDSHIARLAAGCARLGIPMPDTGVLKNEVRKLIGGRQQAVLKIILTRGCSERGYAPADTTVARILSLFSWDGPADTPLRVAVSPRRLGRNPALAGLKHLNRLEQVLARRELPADAGESVMLDIEGRLAEGIAANIFLQQADRLLTPRLDECGVAGVVRQLIMDTGQDMDMPVAETRLYKQDLSSADAIYFSSSLLGIRRVSAIIGQDWQPGLETHPVMDAARRRVFAP